MKEPCVAFAINPEDGADRPKINFKAWYCNYPMVCSFRNYSLKISVPLTFNLQLRIILFSYIMSSSSCVMMRWTAKVPSWNMNLRSTKRMMRHQMLVNPSSQEIPPPLSHLQSWKTPLIQRLADPSRPMCIVSPQTPSLSSIDQVKSHFLWNKLKDNAGNLGWCLRKCGQVKTGMSL